MNVATLLLVGIIGAGTTWCADDPKKAPSTTGQPAAGETKTATSPPATLKRLPNKQTGTATAKNRLADADDAPPDVPGRAIPKPDEKPRATKDLDDDLLRELGKQLTKGDVAEENPALRASQRMRQVEESLAKTDVSDTTLDMQGKIVKDLDELIDELEKEQANENNPQSGESQKQTTKSKPKLRLKRQSGTMAKSLQRQPSATPKITGRQPLSDSVRTAGSKRPEDSREPEKRKDIWGHLSATMRQEMDQYAKDGFLPKYRELLEQYYTTIASRAKRQGESKP